MDLQEKEVLSSDLVEVIIDYIKELLRSQQLEVVVVVICVHTDKSFAHASVSQVDRTVPK